MRVITGHPSEGVDLPEWRPVKWTRHNCPNEFIVLMLVHNEKVIQDVWLPFLVNAERHTYKEWTAQSDFPSAILFHDENSCPFYAFYERDIVAFLKTVPLDDQKRVCPLLPLGVNPPPPRYSTRDITLSILVLVPIVAVMCLGLWFAVRMLSLAWRLFDFDLS